MPASKCSEQPVTAMREKKDIRMKDLPESVRPYENARNEGVSSLSDQELLAVILRSGTRGSSCLDLAAALMELTQNSSFPGLSGILHLSMPELMKIDGIGTVKALQIQCIGELSKRIARSGARRKLSFTDASSIGEYYMEQLRHEEQEHLIAMMLDTKNQLLCDLTMAKGTANTAFITPREIFVEALRHHASHLILVHNHPSGDPTPSRADQEFTRQVLKTGELVGIRLLDHVIIGDQQYYSFAQDGVLGE